MTIPYMQGAEPYFYPGSKIGCLVIHGFMASPAEPRWLGKYLADAGFTVCGVRLAGHGTDYQANARMHWEDWVASAIDGYHMLKTSCEKIALVGHSMGGTVALTLATDERFPVDALVALAAPIQIESDAARAAHVLKEQIPYTDQTDNTPFIDVLKEGQIKRGEAPIGRVRYNQWSTHAVAELVEMADYVYARLDHITVPTLLIYSTKDDVVPITNGSLIAERIGSKTVRQHTLNRSGHIIPQDVECDECFIMVEDFIRRELLSMMDAGA